jgi:hypothetical protein
MKSVPNLAFDLITVEARHVKFSVDIDHKHTYKFCM